MIDVTANWWNAIIIAGICGAIGGLAYELLQTRFGGTDTADAGMIEWFSRKRHGNRTYYDLGLLASILIGAVAAIAFLYFIPPTDILDASGKLATREYDPFRLIPGALIVGSAGGAFLTAMQERVKRVVSETSRNDARKILASGAGGGAGDDDAGGGSDGGGDDAGGDGHDAEPSVAGGSRSTRTGVDPATVDAALAVLEP